MKMSNTVRIGLVSLIETMILSTTVKIRLVSGKCSKARVSGRNHDNVSHSQD